MNCPTPTGSGESVLTIPTSALVRATTRLDVDALLFEAMLSVDVVAIVAVQFSVVPAAVVGLTCTTGEKVALAPIANEAMVQVMFPDAPIAGVTHDHPAGVAIDWKPVPAGTGIVTVSFAAAAGPLLVATTV